MARQNRKYTKEFREEALRLVFTSGRPLERIAQDLGMSQSTLWAWAQKERESREKSGQPPREADELTVSEREELRRLRKEVEQLREDREILKKATAFFAKHTK